MDEVKKACRYPHRTRPTQKAYKSAHTRTRARAHTHIHTYSLTHGATVDMDANSPLTQMHSKGMAVNIRTRTTLMGRMIGINSCKCVCMCTCEQCLH